MLAPGEPAAWGTQFQSCLICHIAMKTQQGLLQTRLSYKKSLWWKKSGKGEEELVQQFSRGWLAGC